LKQYSIMMNFFEIYSDYISNSCSIQQFQVPKKCKWQITTSYNQKVIWEHRLNVKFSHVITIYQVRNKDNTLNVLFTPCAIRIWLFFIK
jgi:hypothetical protein